MRKLLPISLAFMLLLGACSSPQAGQPTPDMVATVVAQTLNAWQPATETPGIVPSDTLAPSATSLPSDTPQPTASPTPPPTATPAPGDPASSLGQPTWKTNFDENKAFFTGGESDYNDGYTHIRWEPGKLLFTSLTNTGFRGWRLAYFKPRNFYLQALIKTYTCADNDQYGLVFRGRDYESGFGYYFGLTCAGKYALQTWKDGSTTTLVNWSENSAILGGPNQINRLGVQMSGNAIKLYANGVLLKEISDDTFPEAGHFGLFVGGISTTGFTYEVDEMAYWELP